MSEKHTPDWNVVGPELLRSLREMLAIHDDDEREGRIRFAKGSYIHKAAKDARAVIAKATGND